MLTRCKNIGSKDWADYGGRGIKICKRWLRGVENFLSDMGEKPKNYSLDRINVNGNYSPSNCRWANKYEQARNRRNNHLIKYCNKKLTISEWSQINNIKAATIERRINLLQWDPIKAITIPTRKMRK